MRMPPKLVLLACLSACAATAAASPGRKDACPATGAVVVVDTGERRLRLCEAGKAVREFGVALGRGGTGKTRQGDGKTPLGAYALGAPRQSRRYHVFIPVGYPTKEQVERGFTGSAIGVHGPDRRYSWLGRLGGLVDWTQGCIAVNDYPAIDEIAAWVRKTGARSIHIR